MFYLGIFQVQINMMTFIQGVNIGWCGWCLALEKLATHQACIHIIGRHGNRTNQFKIKFQTFSINGIQIGALRAACIYTILIIVITRFFQNWHDIILYFILYQWWCRIVVLVFKFTSVAFACHFFAHKIQTTLCNFFNTSRAFSVFCVAKPKAIACLFAS